MFAAYSSISKYRDHCFFMDAYWRIGGQGCLVLNIEQEGNNIAILNNVVLAFKSEKSLLPCFS